MLINNNTQKKKELMLNINKTKIKIYNKKVDKMNFMTNKIKEKSSMFNFSPSEFAFGFQNCQKCYYRLA